MPIGDAIQEMLAGLELGTDPAEVLAEHGFEDLSPEAFSSALVHFAESAPLEVADAIAPIVTRISDVPFEDGDLPPLPEADAILASGGDAFALLSEVGLAEVETIDVNGLLDDPQAAVDEIADRLTADGTDDASQDPAEDETGADDEADETFGQGDESSLPDLDDIADEIAEEIASLDDAGRLDEAADEVLSALDGIDTQTFTETFDQEAAGIDNLDDTDPSDLDMDLE